MGLTGFQGFLTSLVKSASSSCSSRKLSSFVSEEQKGDMRAAATRQRADAGRPSLTVQLEEGLGVELLRVQPIRLLPHLHQLGHAPLQEDKEQRDKVRR